MSKTGSLILLLAAGLSILAPKAVADWSAAQRLTWTSGISDFPAVAIDSVDTIHVVWYDDTPGNSEIYYKRRSGGGTTWSSAQRITWTSGNSNFPAIAIDSSNAIHVVWSEFTPEYSEIYYKKSSDGGTTWSAAQRITWTAGESLYPAASVDSKDALHVVWCDFTPGLSEIYYKTSPDAGTTWSAAKRITWTSGNSEKSAMAGDSSDALHVVWSDYQAGNPEIYYKKSPDAGATWTAAQRLTWNSGNSSRPAIAIDSSSALHVVWNDWTSSSTEIYYRMSPDGGATWNAVKRLTWTSGDSYVPAMAISPPNIIYVVWYDNTPGNAEIYYKISPDRGTTWSTVKRLTWTLGGSYLPVIAMDSGGTAHVVWNDETPGNREIYYKKGN